nr:hypothetical protein CTI12_AA426570 [Tanacetum cinerariifolium]
MTYGMLFDFIGCSTKFSHADLFYCLPGSDLSDGVKELRNDQQFGVFLAVDDDDVEDYDEDECELDDMNVAAGRYASEVDRKEIKETVAKGNGKEKVVNGKGKDKVVENKGKKKVVEGSTVDADAKAGRKK